MAGRPTYAPSQLAQLASSLKLNGGNVERTAKETGIPASTVRDYKKRWEGGLPDEIAEAVDDTVNDVVDEMVRVRNKAIRELEKKLPVARPGELNAIIGTLDDKINRAIGPKRPEVAVGVQINVTPDDLRVAMTSWAQQQISAAAEREADIIEVEAITESAK